jgi:wyosine [tRNA(Phe)-imidazoG37] synthetase (radical SAM superfamily)
MLRFNEIIYGPVLSRRLGVSLGVNLLPIDAKICSFNCIYCECGFNTTMQENPLPSRSEVYEALEFQLQKMVRENHLPDVITFAGNGEPTLHPAFEEIIDDTVFLRNKYARQAKVSVLTNSTRLHKPHVNTALQKVDNAILKFDSAIEETMQLLDQPVGKHITVEWIKEQIKNFRGEKIVQTMFLRGKCGEKTVDNTTQKEIDAWLLALEEMNIQQVMIYTIDRETPVKTLQKISLDELNAIAEKARKRGILVSVAG